MIREAADGFLVGPPAAPAAPLHAKMQVWLPFRLIAQPPCRLKHRTFSSNELRDCDFSERKDDALRLHRTIEVGPHMTPNSAFHI